MAGRHGKYLYGRPGSANWYLRLVYPPEFHASYGKRSEETMGTPDREEALVRASALIRAHKIMLIAARSMRTGVIASRLTYEPGEHAITRERRVIATQTTLIYLDKMGNIISTEPNSARTQPVWQATAAEIAEFGLPGPSAVTKIDNPRRVATKSGDKDLELLTDYLRFKGHDTGGTYAKEARSAWDEFKYHVRGKSIKDCDRSDGRAYVNHLRSNGLKTATVVKRINFLAAPINHANATGDLKGNPFFKVVDHLKDATKRLCFDDADMRLMRERMLPELGRDERIMWYVLATTGMNHAEVFSIKEEFREGDIRYVMVGEKTEARKRKVPLPGCLLPHMPHKISGPLFDDHHLKNISKNLLRAVRRVGITDRRKVVYSLRHRAHTRLREIECPGDIEREIVGHKNGGSHAQYGKHPLRIIKKWIDQIGY